MHGMVSLHGSLRGGGEWWQVVYHLEVCGFDVRSHRPDNAKGNNGHEFYEGWLDYIYG